MRDGLSDEELEAFVERFPIRTAGAAWHGPPPVS